LEGEGVTLVPRRGGIVEIVNFVGNMTLIEGSRKGQAGDAGAYYCYW